MTNTEALKDKIRTSGKKKCYLAKKLGVSNTTLYALLNGRTEFKASQIKALCDELDIRDDNTMKAIFFSQSGA